MRIQGKKPHETAREFAIRRLREKIVMLELEPGSMVSENELAAELGVSRTPVREALNELSKIGIIEVFPQRGSMVSRIDATRIEEARFTRMVLECAVVELACDLVRPEDTIVLEANLRLQQFYLENGELDKLHDLDNDFHRKLFSLCDKSLTYTLVDSLGTHFNRIRRMRLHSPKELLIVEDHQAILEAITLKHKEEARALMTVHLTRYKIDEDVLRARYPGYFVD